MQKGSVRKKGNKWYYRFRVEQPDGSWKLKEFPGTTSKRETEGMLKRAITEYEDTGAVIYAGQLTVADLCDMWYDECVEHSNRQYTTRLDVKNVIRHIKEHSLGKQTIKDIRPDILQQYVDEKYFGITADDGTEIKKGLSESSLRSHFSVLNPMFKFAVYPKRFIRENPMQYVQKRKKQTASDIFLSSPEDSTDYINWNDFQKVVAGTENTDYQLPIQIAYYTGLRAGEICALTWDDIDLQNMCVSVSKSMYYNYDTKRHELKPTKSNKPRIVDFGDSLANILKDHHKRQLAHKLRYGSLYHETYYLENLVKGKVYVGLFNGLNEDIEALPMYEKLKPISFVCAKESGELFTGQTMKWVNKYVKKHVPDVPHFHMHALRHSFATNLVLNNVNFKDVQELMGHYDISITLDTYSHTTKRSRKKAVDIFNTPSLLA